jgi:hypothetical protein
MEENELDRWTAEHSGSGTRSEENRKSDVCGMTVEWWSWIKMTSE